MKSEVYFIKTDTSDIEQRILALKKILDKTSHFLEYKQDEFVPVKLTIGDSSCVYNINPELVKCVVTHIKNNGARPFLFDTNVIYKGQRQNALEHLDVVQSKGFGHSRVGAPFIIADGLFGQDGKEFEINAKHIKKIRIPSFIGMLDSLIVLSHATGHIISGYAGAMKNVAMGMCCRPTKQLQHSSLKPSIIEKKCTSCGCCIAACAVNAISSVKEKAFIEQELCIGCGECICACKFDAILIHWEEDSLIFARRMAEVANFILSGFKNKFFINFAFDITKDCDCLSTKSDKMIAHNLGILASADIVSLDKATADLANKNRESTFLQDTKEVYEGMLKYAGGLGMGNLEYNLVSL